VGGEAFHPDFKRAVLRAKSKKEFGFGHRITASVPVLSAAAAKGDG